MARPKVEKETKMCPLCGKDMGAEFGCNFEQMTQRASWWLAFKPRMTFCGECSSELLKCVNQWYKYRNTTDNYSKFPGMNDFYD